MADDDDEDDEDDGDDNSVDGVDEIEDDWSFYGLTFFMTLKCGDSVVKRTLI